MPPRACYARESVSFQLMTPVPPKSICVVVVTFNAEDFILDCVASVLASQGVDVRLVIVDNASSDGTVGVIRDWASGARDHALSADLPIGVTLPAAPMDLEVLAPGDAPKAGALGPLTLVESQENGGFAAGVNIGVRLAMLDSSIDYFWILNPDSVATPEAAAAFLATAAEHPEAGLFTGRACYYHDPGTIQIDGGVVNSWTGVTSNANVGRPAATTEMPDGNAIDFAFGGNMVVHRDFVSECGEMPEDYFLYYEEVDWSLRRGRFPLVTCKDGLIYHRAGASIGSQIFGGRSASPFSLYFKQRARMIFVRRYYPFKLPIALVYTLAKAAQAGIAGDGEGAGAILKGGLGLGPPRAVAQRLHTTALSDLAPGVRS